MRAPAATIALGVLALASGGCPDGAGANPSMLWLAPDRMEIYVKLVDFEPPPF